MKTLPNGTPYYDRDKLKPELAEDMNVGNMSVTFRLKKSATFHDGTAVTAKDVKWSLNRAVTVGGFPTFQMGAGSLEKPEQFVVVDDRTVRIDFLRKDRLTIPDLAVIVPCVLNSALVQKHVTEQDPWGLEFTKQNTAGSGAYRIVKWSAGTEVVYERNEDWKGGPLPKIKRIIWRMVPSSGNRRALLERGDADISYDLPNKDFAELRDAGKLTIVSTPYSNGIQYIGMNVKSPPFDNLKVRQAVAYVIPYKKIMDAALYGLAKPLYGAPAGAPTEVAWPQPHGYSTNIAKAKALLAEAGYPNGFETTLSFDLGFAGVNEPICVLTQESQAQIGIETTINKIPGANWRTELTKKVMPLYANVRTRCEQLARQVGLPVGLLDRFPHQLSGGQKARVGIARAIALSPDLAILDEPTAALDVSVQAVVLNLLQELKQSLGMSYLFVSHNLNVVRLLCDRVIVMRTGRIVEQGPTERVLSAPQDQYTRDLLAAIPHPRFAQHA
jgi:peptide/nickel transport system substrate-binding protein